MGVFKIYVNKIIVIVFFGSFFSCKPQQKSTEKKAQTQKQDVTFKFPAYLNKNYVLGKFDYTKDANFVVVPKELSSKKIYVRKSVLHAFLKMQLQAKKEKISFKIISGTRNFAHQKRIWSWKWNNKHKKIPPLKRAKKILEYSAMPTTSRHHWGTDIDINSLNNAYFSKGKGKKEYTWLVKNAHKFGFYQVYTSKEKGRTGYNEEKWHWSYIPLSSIYLKYYNQHITFNDITGFKGSKYAKKMNIITKYVNGINIKIVNLKP